MEYVDNVITLWLIDKSVFVLSPHLTPLYLFSF